MNQQSPPKLIYELMLTSDKVWMKCRKKDRKKERKKPGQSLLVPLRER